MLNLYFYSASIKDTLKQIDTMKKLLTLIGLLALIHSVSWGQITSGENIPKEEKKRKEKELKEKEKKNAEKDSLSGTDYYITGTGMWTYRDFEDQSVYGIYDERNNETSAYAAGVTLGLVLPLSKHFSMDIGVTYFGHGEKYAFQDETTDSTFSYKRRYLQVGVPLKLRYTYGEKLQGFAFAGLTPLNILQIRYDAEYNTPDGVFSDLDEETIKNDFAQFNLMATGGLGIRYNLDLIGFTLSAEYRRHLLNTYDFNSIPLDHRMFGIGINAGIFLRF